MHVCIGENTVYSTTINLGCLWEHSSTGYIACATGTEEEEYLEVKEVAGMESRWDLKENLEEYQDGHATSKGAAVFRQRLYMSEIWLETTFK